MMISRKRRALALAGAAVALSLALTGCSALNGLIGAGGDANRDDSGNVQEESDIGIFNLKVGDCKMEDVSGEITDTKVVPCGESHDEEVYDEFTLDDGDYPGDEAVQTSTDEGCYDAFADFAGIAYEDSSLEFFGIRPTQQTWEQANDRVVQCVIWDPAGPVTGSLAGAAY